MCSSPGTLASSRRAQNGSHFSCAGEILQFDFPIAADGKPPDDQDQALRAQRNRFVDRAPVVVQSRPPAVAIGRWKHSAAAIAANDKSSVADARCGLLEASGRDLVAPRRNAADAVAGATVDDLRQRIPSRLRVRTGPAGSELEMSVA